MKTKKTKILILLVTISIGIFISIIMKSNLEYYAPVTLSSLESMKTEINLINDEIDDLKNIVEEKEDELKAFHKLSFSDEKIEDKLVTDISSNKMISGALALKGPGIKIKMYDNPTEEIVGDINDYVIHDIDVLNIFNDLRVAGAEAISINGERVITYSSLKCGGPIIRINGVSVGTPFIIRAIGEPTTLMAAVNAPGTYGEALKNIFGIGFEPETKDEVHISAYSGDFEFKYANPIREGEE